MKKIVLTIFLIVSNYLVHGQITGGFFTGMDYYGNQYVYFKGTNVSPYNLYINVIYFSEKLDQYHTLYYSPLYYDTYFTIGPANNWTWQPGEKVVIVYPNGNKVSWVYSGKKKNVSFQGDYKRYPCPVGGCLCTVYKSKGVWITDCENCDHPKHESRY